MFTRMFRSSFGISLLDKSEEPGQWEIDAVHFKKVPDDLVLHGQKVHRLTLLKRCLLFIPANLLILASSYGKDNFNIGY
jgi:hypothetical protein